MSLHAIEQMRLRKQLISAQVLAIPALDRDDWSEMGVPLGHRARIKQAHKNRHPEMWARRDSEVQ